MSLPFDFGEIFTASVREVLPKVRAKKLAFAFDCHGPQITLSGDPVSMERSLHRLLCAVIDLVDIGFLVFDARTGNTHSGESEIRIRLAATGLLAGNDRASAVLQRLDLGQESVAQSSPAGMRVAKGECPYSGGAIEFVSRPREGVVIDFTLVDPSAERWQPARHPHARQSMAWVIDENAVAAQTLARRLQGLGWSTKIFVNCAQAERALQRRQPRSTTPSLVVAVESESVSLAELGMLDALLPFGVERIFAVNPCSPILAEGERLSGFNVKVFPFSPWELHEITTRLCKRIQTPGGSAMPMPLVHKVPLRLLVVENNPVHQLVTRAMAAAIGYKVEIAADCNEALGNCEVFAPDVVLLNLRSLGLEIGRSLAQQLKELQSKGCIAPCRIVAVLEDSSEQLSPERLPPSVDGCLFMPLELQEMKAELHRVCAGHHGQRPETV